MYEFTGPLGPSLGPGWGTTVRRWIPSRPSAAISDTLRSAPARKTSCARCSAGGTRSASCTRGREEHLLPGAGASPPGSDAGGEPPGVAHDGPGGARTQGRSRRRSLDRRSDARGARAGARPGPCRAAPTPPRFTGAARRSSLPSAAPGAPCVPPRGGRSPLHQRRVLLGC